MAKAANTRVGPCGFVERQARLFAEFDLLEVQQTFYQPPQLNTARRWREAAPADFIFTIKAWQLITHEASSPTYRRLRESLTPRQRALAGAFRDNEVTRMAWARTRDFALALGAKVVLFQTPARFRPTQDHLENLRAFFHRLDRAGLRLAFEPRGPEWLDDLLRPLLRELRLVHAVDPLLRRPLGKGLRYFRLHGVPAYNYRHRYTDAELLRIRKCLSRAWPNLVLFNNVHMAEDARRFRRLVEKNR